MSIKIPDDIQATEDPRSKFEQFCDHMYMEYRYEKSKHQEDDVLTQEEYKVRNRSFLRQAYNEKNRKKRDEEAKGNK
jgi:hypothetical protein